jgi:inositol hexakisphosphate/diphosphoinositol-pentakisphosphate kinase
MDYSADLPINTMGRRIRTRLYFTSESHLHTMLNVLRFAAMDPTSPVCSSPILSPAGMQFLNDTKEVCYLTQIVIRLFEDTSQALDNPRRFRVEILFSAGATATPLHMAESTRESDTSRLDTDPLFAVGRDGLTCTEVEDFFDTIISEGGKGDDGNDAASISTADGLRPSLAADIPKPTTHTRSGAPVDSVELKSVDATIRSKNTTAPSRKTAAEVFDQEPVDTSSNPSTSNNSNSRDPPRSIPSSGSVETIHAGNNNGDVVGSTSGKETLIDRETRKTTTDNDNDNDVDVEDDDESNSSPQDDIMNHKSFYLTVALGSLLLGAGCLVMALALSGKDRSRSSSRRYNTSIAYK